MPTTAQPMTLTLKQQESVKSFFKMNMGMMGANYNIRGRLREQDLQYMREIDRTVDQMKAYRATMSGDPTKFQNIVIPVILPQVEASVTYQTSVFCQGYPMFGVVSGDPKVVDAAQQMDTIVGNQQDRGGWPQEFIKFFRDAAKYNLGAAEISWEQETTFAPESQNRATKGASSAAQLKEVIWEGNVIKRMDLYNTFWDLRVRPDEIPSKGEFAGYHELYSRVALVSLMGTLTKVTNRAAALKSNPGGLGNYGSYGTEGYYQPQLNPQALVPNADSSQFNWTGWAGLTDNKGVPTSNYGNYVVTRLYGRIIPSDFGIDVPGKDVPQVWKFILVNGCEVIYAERMTNAHGLIPIIFGQLTDDGLGYQTKSLLDNVQPFQQMNTALANAIIAAQRRSISDRMLYDPSRVNHADINNDSPTSKIPVKPSAFGTELSNAVHAIPFQNDQFQFNTTLIQQFGAMANQVSGLNPARQGQFVKGNKTRGEFDTIMGNSNGRDELTAISLECSFFGPIKEILKANILQYQGSTTFFNRETQSAVAIDPIALREAMILFKVSDGKVPSEKLLDAQSMGMAFQTIMSVPQIAAGFNIVPMFSYLMKMSGAKISPFEKSPQEQAYEQAANQWMQAVGMVAQEIKATKEITPEQIQQLTKGLPPQPTPQQYGWDPQVQYNSEVEGKSILQSVTEATTGQANTVQSQAPQGQAASAPTGPMG